MRIYRVQSGIVLERDDQWVVLAQEKWDTFINDDALYRKCEERFADHRSDPAGKLLVATELLPPLQSQELWASGVTYFNSKLGREEEARAAGGGDFYARVYTADRPELFFKATAQRVQPSGGAVRIRQDSSWDVPEPELTLCITSSGKIVGYTIGNDMSSRSIEGENPLYLPQAKTYDGCAAVGPGIWVSEEPLPAQTRIAMEIHRGGQLVFSGEIGIDQIKRRFDDLVEYLYRECSFPHGSLLMTGTGIVPGTDFTLQTGDEIRITIEPIGTLVNTVK